MTARAEVLAKVLAEHVWTLTTEPYGWCSCGDTVKRHEQATHVAAVLDAALATQEGEGDGAEVAAAVEAIHGKTHWCHDDEEQPIVYEPGTPWWPCPTLAALSDPAGARADRIEAQS